MLRQVYTAMKHQKEVLEKLEKPIFASIQRKLTEAFNPESLEIIDESSKHAGHAGNPSGDPSAETHFRVKMVSDAFEGQPLVRRHRMVFQILDEEMKTGVHALSLKINTTSEEPSKASTGA
ncbi:hypothetical protein BSKO_10427 [Bryopsis sp. KO-2023]|nr:hypothetical protein BSKO_10427 [Bryopsis sp. KO-2023]